MIIDTYRLIHRETKHFPVLIDLDNTYCYYFHPSVSFLQRLLVKIHLEKNVLLCFFCCFESNVKRRGKLSFLFFYLDNISLLFSISNTIVLYTLIFLKIFSSWLIYIDVCGRIDAKH